jgi:lipopolysaccharide/colanic/teichoic acid biosynthesis glycosyltransferase
LLIALFIKLDSSGPVLYKQKRIGKNGKVFNFYKFRTMIVEKEKSDEENRRVQYRDFINGKKEATKIVDEARVTRIGKILRKMSIDELPQLWNVLIGDMSLIGPRPCLPYEWESYSEWHKKRLSVTPGCSGLWQVSDRKTISFEEMVLLDFYYIENISPWMDLQIILKTIPVMFFGQGGKWE